MNINNSQSADNDDFPVNPSGESKEEDSSGQKRHKERNSKSSKVEVEVSPVQTERQDLVPPRCRNIATPTDVNGQLPKALSTSEASKSDSMSSLEHLPFDDKDEATNQVANMTDVSSPSLMSTQEDLPFEDKAEESNQVANTTHVSQPSSTSNLEHLPNEAINERLENLQLMLSLYDLFDEIIARNKEQEREALERKRKRGDDKDEEPETPI